MLKKFETLLNVPNDYKSFYLSSKLIVGEVHIIKAKVLSMSCTRFLQVNIFAENLNIKLKVLFLNYSQYHINLFTYKKELFLEGKIELKEGFLMIHPKEIDVSKVGKIIIKFSKNSSIELIEESLKNLKNILPNKIFLAFREIYYPSFDFVQNYQKMGFYGVYLESLKFLEAFCYIYKLGSKRLKFLSSAILNRDVSEFITQLPFTLTNDQQKALIDIKQDLSSKIATRRLIVGDVGSGKTVLILASAFISYPKISILMAPTTILANQIYQEAKRLLPSYIKVALFNSNSLDLSEYHFIISTHKLLYKELPKADLIMVDEQHRFGANQRKMLENLVLSSEKKPHYLQFSATPIPRTKAMLDANLIDVSFLKEMPFKKDIVTKIITNSDFNELLTHIKTQIESNHQIVIVYPLVTQSEAINYLSIEEAKEFWTSRFSGVYVTFGKDKAKDEVLDEFRDKGSILLATTLIEVGISLPRLTTIVISGAERLGFATLHQLRGRVARNGLKGYCFLYTKKPNDRLQDFCNTKSGFEIAELDLKYRDSGDILDGKNQSGKSFRFLNLAEDSKIIQNAQKFYGKFKTTQEES